MENECHVVGLMFEDKFYSTPDNPKFYGKIYEYKTKLDLKKGQIIEIETKFGKSRVCIMNENIPVDKITYEGGFENLVEI